ncbi:MAG: helical backbone metal receptor [Wenzhouxiangellaceae bacterium]
MNIGSFRLVAIVLVLVAAAGLWFGPIIGNGAANGDANRAGHAHADEAGIRIVSLAPHLTELAFEAGIGDLLVGAVEWSDYPAAAADIPRIGDAFRFDLERIVRLEATHALAWAGGTPPGAISELRHLGVEVKLVEIQTLEQIAGAIERLGHLGGNEAAANASAADFRRRLERFRQRAGGGQTNVEVFYQVSEKPLFTLGREHVINEVLALCNAANIFGDLETAAGSVDLEAVLARDPLAVVASDAENNNPVAHWQAYPDLRAVACDNMLRVDPALLVRPTPRVLDGAKKLCQWLDREVRPDESNNCIPDQAG